MAIVISHDCDLVQTPSVEPNVEIIVGRAIESPDGSFTYSKNPRKLHLECTAGTQRFLVELVATDKMAVPKEGYKGCLSTLRERMSVYLERNLSSFSSGWQPVTVAPLFPMISIIG